LVLDDLQRVQPPPGAEGLRTLVAADDLLITITADIGSVGVVPPGLGEAYINQHIALVRPTPTQVRPRFLAYAAKSQWGRLHFDGSMQGGTKVGLGLEDVRDMPFGLAPPEEQDAILSWIHQRLKVADGTMLKLKQQNERLQEYRQALITAAVTGQLDIEAAA
jgi:type I restriction enzyme S subunit